MVTAFISRKGGVGKTTTAVNLSAALATQGFRVLLVDLDSQASASLSLGVERGRLAPSAADVLLSGMPAGEAVRATAVAGLDLLTASVDLGRVEMELGQLRGREGRLRTALSPVVPSYDFVFLDCASSLSLLAINAVVAADHFIIPTSPQFLAVTGVTNLIAAAERLAWDAGRRVRALGVLLTMVDYRNRAMRAHVDQIRAEHGPLAFAIEIRVNTRLAEAPGEGKTIFQYDGKATGAAAYRLLAEEYLIRCGVAAPEKPLTPPAPISQPPEGRKGIPSVPAM